MSQQVIFQLVNPPSSLSLSLTDVPPTESTHFPGICPEDMSVEYQQSYSWLPFRGHCYMFITEETEWSNAASNCIRHGKRHSIQTKLDFPILDQV